MPQDNNYEITLYVDGGSRGNPGPAAIGALVLKNGREEIRVSEYIGEATNNVAEYKALVAGLSAAAAVGASSILVKSDSELVVNHLLEKYKVRNKDLRPLYDKAVSLLKDFDKVGIERIPREQNGEADALVNAALDEVSSEAPRAATAKKRGGIVGFLSDFGVEDAWTGIVKGVMKTINPAVDIIDISHDIKAYDIRKGAFVLETAVEHIPAGVFLAVVDPETGSGRRGVIVGTPAGAYLVGPDNGILIPAAARLGGAVDVWQIKLEQADDGESYPTFDAKNMFGPVAARLAGGCDPEELGEPVDRVSLIAAPYGRADIKEGVIYAEIIDVDRYGTLRLNARKDDAEPSGFKPGVNASLSAEGETRPLRIVTTFSDMAAGDAMLLYDSSGYLCVAVNSGDAGSLFQLKAGDRVSVGLKDASLR